MKENVKIFLLSGLLEEYVMGLTSPDQNVEIERYIAEYEEVKVEYENILKNIKGKTGAMSVPPSNEVRAHILSRAKNELKMSVHPLYKHLAIAASLLFLLSVSFTFRFYVNSERLATSNLSMQLALDEMRSNQEESGAILARYDFMTNPYTKTLELKSSDELITFDLMALWNDEMGSGHAILKNVPSAPTAHCYQMWADVDGEMISMGILQTGQEWVELKYLKNAKSLNVTIEKEGGSPHPTVSRLIAKSAVNGTYSI